MKNIFYFLLLCTIASCGSNPSRNNNDITKRVKYWDLKTGSHIAYIHIPAKDQVYSIPLIFLHGGPGACQVNSFGKEAPVEWYEKLAENNFDIYIYDQVGSGFSGRLSDPSQYTVARHVADLQCIREIVGVKPAVLIGDSWGATLASHYMAKYPRNVKKVILTSPGSINLRDWNEEYSPVPRFPMGWYRWVKEKYGEERLNRYLKLDELMQKNVHQAYAFAGDKEMDKVADEFITAVIFETCVQNKDFTESPEFKMEGMGWWASMMTIFDQMNIESVIEPLRNNITPVLILRGDSDYLEKGISEEYDSVFPNSELIRVPEAGHFIWLDKPKIYQREIEKFLMGN